MEYGKCANPWIPIWLHLVFDLWVPTTEMFNNFNNVWSPSLNTFILENISPFPGSGEDKVSHYVEGWGGSAASGARVLISRWRTLLSMPVWDVFTRLFCLKSSHRAAEEHTLSFYCEYEMRGICVFVKLHGIFPDNFKSNIWSNYRCVAGGRNGSTENPKWEQRT